MEGISHEAAALAGAWKLNKLIALYDDNGISIDGPVAPWFIDQTSLRFVSYGWNVLGPIDGHDTELVAKTIAEAKKSADRPTLIICKTHIGKGSPNRANTAKAHGEPLGAEEIKLTRESKAVYADWSALAKGAAAEAAWKNKFAAYKAAYPALAAELLRRIKGDLPKNFVQTAVDTVIAAHTKAETVASRKASQLALESFTAALPELLGGSADLTGSNLTNTKSTPNLRFDAQGNVVQTANAAGDMVGGRHINYGVREFGMAAIMNGVALHGGFIPYGGTFLTFSDYSRNAIRMAALMKLRVIHVFTHDSIGLGEDGPTHQSIEHAASLRLIPNLDVWRPADTAETAVAWTVALQNKTKPTALLLSRQNISYAPKAESAAAPDACGLDAISKGAYVLAEPSEVGLKKKAQAVIIATGSEVQLALKAQELLATRKIAVRVVSMPSNTTFDKQSAAFKAAVLPAGVPRVAVEMGVSDGWWKYGVAAVVGIDTYGESAPAPVLFKHFGFTPENVADTVQTVLARKA
jgi:transketolase